MNLLVDPQHMTALSESLHMHFGWIHLTILGTMNTSRPIKRSLFIGTFAISKPLHSPLSIRCCTDAVPSLTME